MVGKLHFILKEKTPTGVNPSPQGGSYEWQQKLGLMPDPGTVLTPHYVEKRERTRREENIFGFKGGAIRDSDQKGTSFCEASTLLIRRTRVQMKSFERIEGGWWLDIETSERSSRRRIVSQKRGRSSQFRTLPDSKASLYLVKKGCGVGCCLDQGEGSYRTGVGGCRSDYYPLQGLWRRPLCYLSKVGRRHHTFALQTSGPANLRHAMHKRDIVGARIGSGEYAWASDGR